MRAVSIGFMPLEWHEEKNAKIMEMNGQLVAAITKNTEALERLK